MYADNENMLIPIVLHRNQILFDFRNFFGTNFYDCKEYAYKVYAYRE